MRLVVTPGESTHNATRALRFTLYNPHFDL